MTQTETAEVTRAPEPSPSASARTGRALVAVMVLVGAIMINLVQFREIDRNTVNFFDAVHRSGTADIMEQGYRQCAYCRDRYGLHLAIQVVAPGSTVFVPDSSPYGESRYLAQEFTLRLYSLGRVGQVEWVDYEPPEDLLTGGLDPTRFVIASGPGGRVGAPWALALDTPVPDLATTPDPDQFLVEALQAGEHRNSGRPPREFIVLQWMVARPDSNRDYQDLVLETSLLPEPVRQGLIR